MNDANVCRDGLWLYQYGFDRKESGFIDGAYFRGVILSELAVASRIFCVRPINHRWKVELPRSFPELDDLKTETGLESANIWHIALTLSEIETHFPR